MGSDELSGRSLNAEPVHGTYEGRNTDAQQNGRHCKNQHEFREGKSLFHGGRMEQTAAGSGTVFVRCRAVKGGHNLMQCLALVWVAVDRDTSCTPARQD